MAMDPFDSSSLSLDLHNLNRRCSHCGLNGHNSRTCPERGGVRLFGVRLTDGLCVRKSFSMGNLAQYNAQSSGTPEHSESGGAGASVAPDGYVSDGQVQTSTMSSSVRERKKGVPWTEEEHRMFLIGLQKLGKGDWRGISRNFVTSRTPTQVASHAQKYFLRQSNLNKRKRRSSLFDIPADAVPCSMELDSQNSPELRLPIPELSLGRSSPPAPPAMLETSAPRKHADIPPGQFPLPPISPGSLPGDLCLGRSQKLRDHLPDSFWHRIAESEHSIAALQRRLPLSSESSRLDGSTSPLGPDLGSESQPLSSKLFHLPLASPIVASDNRIIRPTATVPSTLARIDEAVELSNLSLSIGPPSVQPSPLSLKLDQPSRPSAFHSSPSISSSSMGSNGSLNSAISVV